MEEEEEVELELGFSRCACWSAVFICTAAATLLLSLAGLVLDAAPVTTKSESEAVNRFESLPWESVLPGLPHPEQVSVSHSDWQSKQGHVLDKQQANCLGSWLRPGPSNSPNSLAKLATDWLADWLTAWLAGIRGWGLGIGYCWLGIGDLGSRITGISVESRDAGNLMRLLTPIALLDLLARWQFGQR